MAQQIPVNGVEDRVFAYDVFLSYNSAQRDWTRALARRLRADGFRVFFDEWEMPKYIGKTWIDVLSQNVARTVILIWSPEFFSSEWTSFESNILQSQDPNGKKILFLTHTPCDLPRRFAALKGLPFSVAEGESRTAEVGSIEFEFRYQQLLYNLDPSRPFEGDFEQFKNHYQERQLTDNQSRVKDAGSPLLSSEDEAGQQYHPTYSETSASQVQLSVHYPPQVGENVFFTLLTYIHVPDALGAVQEQTNLRLGRRIADGYLKTTGIAMRDIGRGAEITVVPYLPDCVVSPEWVRLLWLEDWHCQEFHVKSIAQANGRLVGQIAFYLGPVLICEIAVFIRISPLTAVVKGTTTTSGPYQSIFVSYSHDDSVIVEHLEKAYTVLGLRYLRDIRILRSGEQWNPALLSKIEEADIFQLCWSNTAKRSEYVEKEWKYALGLNREYFLRPVYWQTPMPEPPIELARIHFAFLDLRP